MKKFSIFIFFVLGVLLFGYSGAQAQSCSGTGSTTYTDWDCRVGLSMQLECTDIGDNVQTGACQLVGGDCMFQVALEEACSGTGVDCKVSNQCDITPCYDPCGAGGGPSPTPKDDSGGGQDQKVHAKVMIDQNRNGLFDDGNANYVQGSGGSAAASCGSFLTISGPNIILREDGNSDTTHELHNECESSKPSVKWGRSSQGPYTYYLANLPAGFAATALADPAGKCSFNSATGRATCSASGDFYIEFLVQPPAITCTLTPSGSQNVCTGQTKSYTSTCSVSGGTITQSRIYNKPTTGDGLTGWQSTTCASGSCSRSITWSTAGTYYVTLDAQTALGGKCTGNPWCEWPPSATPQLNCAVDYGTTDCGGSDVLTVNVGSSYCASPTPTPSPSPSSPPPACAAPSLGKSAVCRADGFVDVNWSWSSVPSASTYRFQKNSSNTWTAPQVDITTAALSYATTGITSGANYYGRVRVETESGTSCTAPGNWSTVSSGTLDCAALPSPSPSPSPSSPPSPCSAPTLPAPTQTCDASNNRDVTFNWSDVAGTTLYQFQVDDVSPIASPFLVNRANLSASNFLWQDVTAFGTRYARVRVYENSTCTAPGTWSATRSFNVTACPALQASPSPSPSPPTVALTPIPTSGVEPLLNVDLRATVGGGGTGSIRYQFDCTNNATYELDVTSSNTTYTAIDLCDYLVDATYTAAVTVTRQSMNVSDTALVVVSGAPSPSPSPSPSPTPQGTIRARAVLDANRTGSCTDIRQPAAQVIPGTGFALSRPGWSGTGTQGVTGYTQWTQNKGPAYTLVATPPNPNYSVPTYCRDHDGIAFGTAGSTIDFLASYNTITWDVGFQIPQPWLQVRGGSVHSNDDIDIDLPVGQRFLLRENPSDPQEHSGLVTYENNSTITRTDLDAGLIVPDAQHTFDASFSYYDYYYRKFGGDAQVITTNTITGRPGTGNPAIVLVRPTLPGVPVTVNSFTIAGNDSLIVLVEGSLTVNANIRVNTGGFLAFIVRDNITVNPQVGFAVGSPRLAGAVNRVTDPHLTGIYITDGTFTTLPDVGLDRQVALAGTFVADTFVFGRDLDLDNAAYPGELFIFRPDLWAQAPQELKEIEIRWEEVNP